MYSVVGLLCVAYAVIWATIVDMKEGEGETWYRHAVYCYQKAPRSFNVPDRLTGDH